jgi:hypothetical protein
MGREMPPLQNTPIPQPIAFVDRNDSNETLAIVIV